MNEIRPRLPDYFRKYMSRIRNLKEAQLDSIFNKDKGKSLWQANDTGAYFEGVARITTLDEALEYCNADLTVWEVDRYVFNKWEVGAKDADKNIQVTPLFQIKIWFRKRELNEDELFQRFTEKYTSRYKPPKFKETKKIDTGNCAILNIYDAHLDKIPIKAETGVSSTLEQNIEIFKNTFDQLLTGIKSHNPEKIIIPLGNDLYHTNGMNGRTKKGTELQYFCSPEDAYMAITDVVIESVLKASQVAPVELLPVKSNHSEDKDNILVYWLSRLFESHPSIDVRVNRMQRNYDDFGLCMFGFAHGDKAKKKVAQLPLMMAQEQPDMWARTKFRTFYLGDIHHEQEFQFLKSKDYPGVTVRFLRGISQPDEYHVSHGWIGIPKTAYADIWNKEKGEIASIRVNVC